MARKRAFVAHTFHSIYSNYSRGVTILIAKSLSCTIKSIATDPYGGYVIAVIQIDNAVNTFMALYVPPPFTIAFWKVVMAQLLQMAEGPIVLAGDFNSVLSPNLDRLKTESVAPSRYSHV